MPRFPDGANTMSGAAFLREAAAAFPMRSIPGRPALGWGAHIFDRVCREHGIEHKMTRPYHPRINGQAERTIKEERHR